MCGGGGTTVEAPQPSPEERALQQKQVDLLSASEARNKAWDPVLMKEMGYVTDAAGNIRELTDAEKYAGMTGQEKANYDIQSLANERQIKALKGELEIDPGVTRSLSEGEQMIREQMARNLGPGWETSEPGRRALADVAQRRAETEYAVRQGEMTNAQAISGTRQDQAMSLLNQTLQNATSDANKYLPVAQSYQMPLSWYQQQRQAQLQADMQNAQIAAANQQALISGISGIAGAGLGAYLSPAPIRR